MKFSREKKIILLSALAGMVFALRVVQFAQQLDELASAVNAKSEEEQPAYLRSRYKPATPGEHRSWWAKYGSRVKQVGEEQEALHGEAASNE